MLLGLAAVVTKYRDVAAGEPRPLGCMPVRDAFVKEFAMLEYATIDPIFQTVFWFVIAGWFVFKYFKDKKKVEGERRGGNIES